MKFEGAILNVVADVNKTYSLLANNALNMVNLKRTLKRHVFFEPKTPGKLPEALHFLKQSKTFYGDIETNKESLAIFFVTNKAEEAVS